jgi:hypothetical protein
MRSYLSLPREERRPEAKGRRRIYAAVAVCAVCALVGAVSVRHSEPASALLAKDADAAQIRAAAAKLEIDEATRVQQAKAALVMEEQREQAVRKQAKKMEEQAREAEIIKKVDAAAERQYEEARTAAIDKAAATIEEARKAKITAEGEAKQKLGANNDKYLDLNPPQAPPSQRDPFSDLDPPVYHAKGSTKDDKGKALQKPKSGKQKESSKKTKLGANDDKFIDLNPPTFDKAGQVVPTPPEKVDSFADLDPPIVKASKSSIGAVRTQHLAQSGESAADRKVATLERELQRAKQQALRAASKVAQQQLVGSVKDVAKVKSDRDPPTFYEGYKKGMKGPMADSKWVPQDHPAGHKKCKLHDIDCDELWPWGKISSDELETKPQKRHGPLGDNLVGVFGQDDVVVPTADSGLIQQGKEHVEQFDHWPVNSKKNKDLLYGNARYLLSDKYLGVGDKHMKRSTAEAMAHDKRPKGQPLADLMFGSWEQGFHKPHHKSIKKDVNMYNQPYRQMWSVAKGKGHQVFKDPYYEKYDGPTRGEDDDEDKE